MIQPAYTVDQDGNSQTASHRTRSIEFTLAASSTIPVVSELPWARTRLSVRIVLMLKSAKTLLLLALASSVYGAVKLPALISDHMVLQQGMPVRIWGAADPGESV